jgi:hypothetical protein
MSGKAATPRVHWWDTGQYFLGQLVNGGNFIASDPLEYAGAAVATRGRSRGLQIENLRPLVNLVGEGHSIFFHGPRRIFD